MRYILLMLVLSMLIYSSVSLAAKVSKQYTTEERLLEQTKLAVIEELAEMGNNSAYIVLAKMGENRPFVTPPSEGQLIRWYTSSAQGGNPHALLWLGHYFLHGKGSNADSEYDALVLLASAAILGSIKAANDLVLIPKVLGASYAQLEEAFYDAIQRLSKGQVVNCSRLTCSPEVSQQSHFASEKISQKAEIFRDNWAQFGDVNAYQYLKSLGAERLLAQSNNISALTENIRIQNAGKLRKNERLAEEKRLAESPDWEMQTYLDRLSGRKSSAQDALRHYKDQDFARLEKDIRHTINLINFHRDPDAQISYEDVLQKMKKAP
ncbi:MAG: hypothetical protein GXP14_11885 [Gammaproteobacteria bacterium]|nr:hypothetical protein [Gammaproteobacteria bacterium]